MKASSDRAPDEEAHGAHADSHGCDGCREGKLRNPSRGHMASYSWSSSGGTLVPDLHETLLVRASEESQFGYLETVTAAASSNSLVKREAGPTDRLT